MTRIPFAMERPAGLRETTVLMCLFNLAGYLMVPWQSDFLVFCTLLVGISFVVLWNYWMGRNWARIMVIFASVLALLNLLGLPRVSLFLQVSIVAEAVLGGHLLYWLTRPSVVAFFKRPGL